MENNFIMQQNASYRQTARHQSIRRVLLVDDNPDDIALTRRALASAEFAVHLEVLQNINAEASSFDTSSNQLHSTPDLILVDLNMSKVDGLQLIRRIRQQRSTLHTPVVVISTSSTDEDVLRCYDLGANSYIRRAIDFTEYAQILREVCAYWLNRNISPVCSATVFR